MGIVEELYNDSRDSICELTDTKEECKISELVGEVNHPEANKE